MDAANDITPIITAEIMRIIREGGVSPVSKASADDFDGESYEDGWGWREADESELARLAAHRPDQITELQDKASDSMFSLDAVDTLIGFDDGTHWKLHGWSVYQLISRLTTLGYVDD